MFHEYYGNKCDKRLGEGGTQAFVLFIVPEKKADYNRFVLQIHINFGAPGGNRTLNLGVRSALLCPFELLGQLPGL
jgi:hypothetical protein